MPIWKTSKTFIKNIISNAWGEDEVEPFIGSDEKIRASIEDLKPDLWQEGYIELDNAHWKPRDYEKIRLAAIERLDELKDLEE